MTDQKLQSLVDGLPELYQVIYGHPEWDGEAARDCRARLVIIEDACRRLSGHLDRPLKVLDLGCAQGFFSLSLAGSGATVTGVDFQAENIAVCSALAEENPDLSVSFVQARIEDFVERLEPGEYDVVLGLSVFHHLVYLYGIEHVARLLTALMNDVNLGIFEFALKEEPLYWGSAQPDDPRDQVPTPPRASGHDALPSSGERHYSRATVHRFASPLFGSPRAGIGCVEQPARTPHSRESHPWR